MLLSPRYWTFLLIVAAAIIYSVFKPADSSRAPDAAAATAGPGDRSGSGEQPFKNATDPYGYRYLTLTNGLKVLLVSTPGTDKAAAAMTVDVGSGDDPAGREGLAHFLEHMLFLGTDPYPDSGEYQAYITRHGGSHNAFTAHSQTTYFFSINNDALDGALDRFAPFFISPRFDEAYVDREKNAVNAEYSAKLKEDFRRIYSAEKQAMNPAHPFAHFATGNLDTLSDRPDSKVRDDLVNFYNNHYSSDRMTLVLAGNYPLEQLQGWAEQRFNSIPKRDLPVAHHDPVPMFAAGQLPLDMNIEPVKEIRRLQFTFPMPENLSLYQYKPIQLLNTLIGHEGEGSVLALLKQKGWAEALSAGTSLSTRNESNLVIQIDLTRAGLLHVENVTQILDHYFHLLKDQPIPEYILKEQQQLAEMAFRFREQENISDYVVRLSSNMLIYPPQDVIYGDYEWRPISQKQLQPYLDALDMRNVLRTLIAPKVATDTTDPWYGTAIRIRPGDYRPDEVQTDDLAALALPAANPFIASDLESHADQQQDTPSLLINEPGRLLWYYPETEFSQPTARMILQLQRQDLSDPVRLVTAQLYARAVNEKLNTYSYPASIAGLDYSLSAGNQGIQLVLNGYQDKQPELLRRILEQMGQVLITDDEFDRYRYSLRRKLENQLKATPYERGMAELKRWIYEPGLSEAQLLAALDQVSRQQVQDFAADLATVSSTRIYVHGNVSHQRAEQLASMIAGFFPASSDQAAAPKLLQAPLGHYQQNLGLDHQDKALVLYMQGTDNGDHNRAVVGLLSQILSAPYYQSIRTEQQLGYIVFATAYPQRTVPALLFIVQSPSTEPQELLQRSQTFFENFRVPLAAMTDQEFKAFKDGLVTLLTEPAKNMGEKADKFWRDIDIGRAGFDTSKAIAEQVKTVTKDEVLALYENMVVQGKTPWLAFTQGGTLTDWQPLDSVDRASLPAFQTNTGN